MMWGMLPIGSGADRGRSRPAALTGAILLIVALAAAVSVDVVKNGYGVKSDESTYVAMTLSAAYDHDFTYERRDLERFVGLYRMGPDGIFLKRGKIMRVRLTAAPPFVHLTTTPDPRPDRLYFGKALIYPLVAAPFVRLLGLNGFLVLHVLLLFGVCVCGYTFLAARSRPGPALIFTLAFVFATCVPVYAVFLMPEVLNFSLVFYALFLWLYKEVSPAPAGRFLVDRPAIWRRRSSSASPRIRRSITRSSSRRSSSGRGGSGASGSVSSPAPCAS